LFNPIAKNQKKIGHFALNATMRITRSKAPPWNELSSRLCLASDVIAALKKLAKNQAEPERHWFTRQSLVTSWWRSTRSVGFTVNFDRIAKDRFRASFPSAPPG
jgi:hypothetical protein